MERVERRSIVRKGDVKKTQPDIAHLKSKRKD
jgi:hypothetical protein